MELNRFYMKINVDYCIKGDNFNPHENMDELRIQNARSFQRGEKYIGKIRNKEGTIEEIERERPWGLWGVGTECCIGLISIEDHIEYLLQQLEPHNEIIKKILLSNKGFESRFYIYYEFDKEEMDVGGYDIECSLLQRMSVLCSKIEFRFSTREND